MSGEIYTVPVGLTLHCPLCPRGELLRAGDKCWINDDDSKVYCTKHAPTQKAQPKDEPPEREPLWMAYE
jgi:hypothetical protein